MKGDVDVSIIQADFDRLALLSREEWDHNSHYHVPLMRLQRRVDGWTFLSDCVMASLDNLSIPFTNNLAERDLRLAKVQQKISGTFRSATGVTAFCRIRSYLSTMHKQEHPMLAALTAVFHGQPLPVAWEPE
jgi:Transposase IS66 family